MLAEFSKSKNANLVDGRRGSRFAIHESDSEGAKSSNNAKEEVKVQKVDKSEKRQTKYGQNNEGIFITNLNKKQVESRKSTKDVSLKAKELSPNSSNSLFEKDASFTMPFDK